MDKMQRPRQKVVDMFKNKIAGGIYLPGQGGAAFRVTLPLRYSEAEARAVMEG